VSAQARLRSEAGTAASAGKAAHSFLELLFAGNIEGARRRTIDGFEWFARKDLDWAGSIRTFVTSERTTVGAIRLLEPLWLFLLSREEVQALFGALEDADQIVMADLIRSDRPVTIAIVVRGNRVVRVTDAGPFKRAMLRIRDQRAGQPQA
jgi:hypothetical protein